MKPEVNSEMTTSGPQEVPCNSPDAVPCYDSDGNVERWISDARAGCPDALGHLADRCRQYLLLVANRELNKEIRSKEGASDMVQKTLLTAQQVFERFEGTSEGEYRVWLKRILLNKVAHTSRAYRWTAKRDVRREQHFHESSSDVSKHAAGLIDEAPTPFGAAIANERAAILEATIRSLPEHYQQVIVLRSFERRTFSEIGERLNVSADAVRKRWCQAIKQLRQQWMTDSELR